MDCRPGCGACCIAPSISSHIPGMPAGKPSGIACAHLQSDFSCALFGRAERPKVCSDFKAEEIVCGKDRNEAMLILYLLEGGK